MAPQRESRREEIAGYRRELDAHLRSVAPRQLDIVDAVKGELDDDAIVVGGMTNIGYWSYLAYPVSRPRSFLTSSYFGTLGFAFPMALGAKVAEPDRQVVAICGDGGFLYGVLELSTAVKFGLDVVALVFNNSAYGASRWDQSDRFDERYIGTDLLNPDFVKLAESFGAVGMKTEPGGLGAALREALAGRRPAVVEVVVPNMNPPF